MGLSVNFSSVIERFEKLGYKVEREVQEKALKSGAEVILQELRQEVARNVFDTGELLMSLDMYKTSIGKDGISILIGPNTDKQEIIERNYYQHYGNSNMAGKKHLTVAFERGYEDALEETIRELKGILR